MNKKRLAGSIAILVAVLLLIGGGILLTLNKLSNVESGNELDIAWYDQNAKEFTLKTADELFELAELSKFYDFKDQTIKLGADIIINEGDAESWNKEAPGRKWIPIDGFAGIFDGQGYTISGLYATGFDTQTALFSNTKSNCVVKDFKLLNSYFKTKGYGGTASIASNGGGNFEKIYTDAIIECQGDYCGGIFSKALLKTNITECWFDGTISMTGRNGGGILDGNQGAPVQMNHCLFSGQLDCTWDYSGSRIGGLCGALNKEGATLEINDSLSTGKISAVNVYYTGGTIGVVAKNTALEAKDTYGSMGAYDVVIGRSGESGTFRGAPIEIREQDLIGIKAYEWTNLDFDKYWTTVTDKTPVLQYFTNEVQSTEGLKKAYDLNWYDETKSEYVISTLEELYGLRMVSASTDFKGKTVKLGTNIKVNDGTIKEWLQNEPENPWYPLGKFAGTFDGQGYTVSGIYVKNGSQQLGFFRETLSTSTVKNFNLKDSYFHYNGTSNAIMGSIAGRGNGTYDTVYSNATLVSSGTTNGGLIGQINNNSTMNKVTNCWFDGSLSLKTQTGRYGGGIVGNVVKGTTYIEHCLNTGTISSELIKAGVFAGGIVSVTMNEGTALYVTDCFNAGKVETAYDVCVGSVIGRIQTKSQVTIQDTYATTESYQHPSNGFMGIGTQSQPTRKGGVADYYKSAISGYGAYQKTTLDFNNYWAVQTNDTPILKSFAKSIPSLAGQKKLVDISWYNEEATNFIIDSKEDLYGLYIMSAMDTFEGKTIKLGKDIIANSGNAKDWSANAPAENWIPLKKFAGTFDGQGNTISGIYMNIDYGYGGLFSTTTESAVIKNMKLTNSYFTTSAELAAMGSIVGQLSGTLDTIYSNAIVESNGTQFGGLVGRVNSVENKFKATYQITNCWFDGEVKRTGGVAEIAYIGGIAGSLVQGTLHMDNCLNTALISYMYDSLPVNSKGETHYIGVHVGGLLGGIMNGLAYKEDGSIKMISEFNVKDCMNSGLISSGLIDGSRVANGACAIFGYSTKGTVHLDNVYATKESATRMTMHNTSTATLTGNVTTYTKDAISGIRGYQYTTLDFNKYWAARVEEVPGLKSFVNGALNVAGVWRPDMSWYNEKSDTFTISTIEQLYGLASLVNDGNDFKDKTVKLGANIDMNEGWTAGIAEPSNVWTPLMDFAGTFDGQGKTISGIYVNTSAQYAGFFGRVVSGGTVKNLSLKNSYFRYDGTAGFAALGSIAGEFGGALDTVYSDAIVETTKSQVGGMIGRINDLVKKANGIMTITNCWFDGEVNATKDKAANIGGFVGTVVQGTLNMSHCLNTGDITSVTSSVGGYTGGFVGQLMNNSSALEILDGLNTGVVTVVNKNCVAAILGGSSKTSATYKVENVYATNESYSEGYYTVGKSSKVPVTGNAVAMAEGNFLGVKGYQFTNLDFDTYWSAVEGKAPQLTSFVGEGLDLTGVMKMDISWYNENDEVYTLTDISDLYGFASLVNDGNTFEGKTVKLGADIDVNKGWTKGAKAPENVWTPLQKFAGIFDGNKKSIAGIYVNTTTGIAGFFGRVEEGGIIKNLSLTNSYINCAKGNVGSVVGQLYGNMDNVYSNATVIGGSQNVGGLVGGFTGPTEAAITNCHFAGSVSAPNKYVGGIAGRIDTGNKTIANCLNTGAITSTYTSSTDAWAGGILGGMTVSTGATNPTLVMKNCVTTGQVNAAGKDAVGSVIGRVRHMTTFENIFTTDKRVNTAENNWVTKNTIDGIGSHSTNGNTVTGAPVIVNFAVTEVLNDTTEALNASVKANNAVETNTSWKFWEAKEGVPVLGEGTGEVDATPDTSWYEEGKKTYVLSDAGDLFGFATLVNGGEDFGGQTVKLAENIKLNNGKATNWANAAPANVWTSIGKSSKPFAGTFDGQGHTISGLYINTDEGYAGLFGYCNEDSEITNLRLENSYIYCTKGNVGSVVGQLRGNMSDVYSNAIVNNTNQNIGGLVGGFSGANSSSIVNCWFAGSVTGTAKHIGGIVGRIDTGNKTIANCVNTGTVTSTCKDGFIGGILGGLQVSSGSTAPKLIMKNCVMAGQVNATATGAVGSIVGRTLSDATYGNVYTTDNRVNTAGSAWATKNEYVGAGSYSTGNFTIKGEPKKVDFTATNVLAETLLALNTEVNANTDWDTWTQQNGVPVLTSFQNTIAE